MKSLVLVCDSTAVVALVPGDRRGDPEKVARAVGAGYARVAKRDEVERATGFAPGAVAPFALSRVSTVLLDRTLLRHPIVWVGAGSPQHIVGLAPVELARLARAKPVDVVRTDVRFSRRGKRRRRGQPQGALTRCKRPRRSG